MGIFLVFASQLWCGVGYAAVRLCKPPAGFVPVHGCEAGGMNRVPVCFSTKSALGNVIAHPPARPARGWRAVLRTLVLIQKGS